MAKICIDAFKNLSILNQYNKLSISSCGLASSEPVRKFDFINDDHLTQIRDAWLSGNFPDACNNCKKVELAGSRSRRMDSNVWYNDHGYHNTNVELLRLDYWTGDTCNLRCAICGPMNSSAWKEELGITGAEKKANHNYFWRNLDLSTLKFVHFTGGEPLLSKEHIKFLAEVSNKSQVQLNYNTNGTILPNKRLLDLWSKFNLVKIDFSIDDIGERFEYQRFPASWDQVTQNLLWYVENSPVNCMFSTNTSVGILNHDNLENLDHWLKTNFFTNRVSDEVEFLRQPVFGLFALENASGRCDQIINFLNQCDQRRGTDWRSVFPNLESYLLNTP
jgi:sulfatase maturation enzyme AslB (radical SAM superfamily)